MMVVEGKLSKVPFNRHLDTILDIHAKTWIQRRQDWFGRTWGWPNPAQFRLVASSIAPLRRLVNFGLIHRVNSEFLAYSHTSLVLDIARLIYRPS